MGINSLGLFSARWQTLEDLWLWCGLEMWCLGSCVLVWSVYTNILVRVQCASVKIVDCFYIYFFF